MLFGDPGPAGSGCVLLPVIFTLLPPDALFLLSNVLLLAPAGSRNAGFMTGSSICSPVKANICSLPLYNDFCTRKTPMTIGI